MNPELLYSGNIVSFTYSDKQRIVKIVEVVTTQKTGKPYILAQEITDGNQHKRFTIEKIDNLRQV